MTIRSRFVFSGEIQDVQGDGIGLWQLLDRAADCIMKRGVLWEEEFGGELRDVTRVIVNWERNVNFDLAEDKGQERQAKTL